MKANLAPSSPEVQQIHAQIASLRVGQSNPSVTEQSGAKQSTKAVIKQE